MATLINTTAQWANADTQKTNTGIWQKWVTFTNGQAPNKTLWFLFSLVFQGVLFLPVPAALSYYYNAPIFLLALTLCLFFANIIAGMGGSSIRTMLTLFALSALIHLTMLAVYIL